MPMSSESFAFWEGSESRGGSQCSSCMMQDHSHRIRLTQQTPNHMPRLDCPSVSAETRSPTLRCGLCPREVGGKQTLSPKPLSLKPKPLRPLGVKPEDLFPKTQGRPSGGCCIPAGAARPQAAKTSTDLQCPLWFGV